MESTNVRVTGTMLLNQDYNNSNICIWGYPQEVSGSGKEFKLKTTDNKNIPVIMTEPIGEYLNNLIQIRGQFDGRRIEAASYSQFLPEMTEDFDANSYNECVNLLNSQKK